MLKNSAEGRPRKYSLVKLEFHYSSIILFFIISNFLYLLFGLVDIIPSDTLFFISVFIISNLLVLLSIIIHEYAHILIGDYFGVRTTKILIFAFGARSEMEEFPNRPIPYLLISLAGPTASLFISLFFYAALVSIDFGLITHFIFVLVYFNLFFGLFNLLLPIYPADGGRILHSIIWILCNNRIKAMIMCLILGPIFFLVMLIFVGFHLIHVPLLAVLSYFGWREYKEYSSPS